MVERIPIIGWWSQRRFERFFGPKFWLRPMLVEVCFGLATAALYWMEIEALAWNVDPSHTGHSARQGQHSAASCIGSLRFTSA